MFGINDPVILIVYLLSFVCVGFSIWFGITRWNRDEDTSNNPPKSDSK